MLLLQHLSVTYAEVSTAFRPFPLGGLRMPTPFFHRLPLQPIHVAFEDIVPAVSSAARVRQRAVYAALIQQWPLFLNDVVRDRVESQLRPYRQPAWEGHLDAEAFHALLDVFLACKVDFPPGHGGGGGLCDAQLLCRPAGANALCG